MLLHRAVPAARAVRPIRNRQLHAARVAVQDPAAVPVLLVAPIAVRRVVAVRPLAAPAAVPTVAAEAVAAARTEALAAAAAPIAVAPAVVEEVHTVAVAVAVAAEAVAEAAVALDAKHYC